MTPRSDQDEHEFDDLSWEAQEALGDPEGPQARDLVDQDDDETPTVPCPHCGRQIAEFADRCPYCGDWVVQAGRTRTTGRGLAFAVIALLLVLALIYLLMR